MTCRSELALYILFDILYNRDLNGLLILECVRNILSLPLVRSNLEVSPR